MPMTPLASTSPFSARLLAASVLAAAAVLATPSAHATGRLVDVRVTDRDTGRNLPVHHHQGRYYVAGTPGTRYAVNVRNRSGERVLAVVSVDGVNAVTGETAAWSQAGYVLSPWQRYSVTGWRKSLDEVAGFEFSSLGDAYATRTGRPAHVGVIGVAVFRERPAVIYEAPARDSAESTASPLAERRAAAPSTPAPSLGTAHGEREASRVRNTRFDRAQEQPDEVIALHYDSRENLVALGVLPRPRPEPRALPQPFPESPVLGFVPDPPRAH